MSGKNRRSWRQTLEIMASRDIKRFDLNRRQQRELANSVLRNVSEILRAKPTSHTFEAELESVKTKLEIAREDHRNAINELQRLRQRLTVYSERSKQMGEDMEEDLAK